MTVAGLKEGDRLVEVNGVSVESEPYNEVFRRIKAAGDHISLLVVDCATEQYLRQHDVIIDGQMTQVLRVTCPDVNPAAAVATATDSGMNSYVRPNVASDSDRKKKSGNIKLK